MHSTQCTLLTRIRLYIGNVCVVNVMHYLYNVMASQFWPSIKQTVTKKNDIYLLLLLMFDIPLKFNCIEKPCVEKNVINEEAKKKLKNYRTLIAYICQNCMS